MRVRGTSTGSGLTGLLRVGWCDRIIARPGCVIRRARQEPFAFEFALLLFFFFAHFLEVLLPFLALIICPSQRLLLLLVSTHAYGRWCFAVPPTGPPSAPSPTRP